MKLINGDCLEEMDKLIEQGVKVDAIITDPPYGMKYISSRRKCKHKAIIGDDTTDMNLFFKKSFEILKDNSHLYVFCNEYCIGDFRNQIINAGFKIKRMLVWVKNNHTSGDLLGDYANQTEYILFAHKGRKLLNNGRDRNVLNYKRVNTDLHPTAKPVDLQEFLIGKSTTEGDVILDPFMGSGSCGVACQNLNRDFIGIELDQEYFNIASERIINNRKEDERK